RCHFYKSSFFSPRIPIMTTVGNHEYKKDPDVQNYRRLFAYEGLSYQGISSNTDTYYAIQEGSVLFISLCTETETHANNTQVNWLKQVLAAAEKDPTVTFVTSICHRPLCSESYIDDYSPWLKETVVPILSSCRKHVLHVAAHHHYYQRGQVPEGDFHHIISGGASWDQFWSMAPTTYDNDLVQKTHDYWAYQIFDYDPETQKMTVESYSIGNKNVVHDNMLIDRFSRDLSKTARPDKPVLTGISSQVELPTTLQSSDYVSAVSGDFNSAQFQIALSEDFKKPLVDRTQHFENFFKDGGPKFYIPTNTQKDKDATSLLLEKGDLQAGDYFLRVRYRNQNLQWSEWSDAKALHVTLKAIEDVEPSMSFEKNLFKTGEAVAVTFRNVPTNTKAWVGVYKRGTVYPKDKSVKYFYTDGKDDNSRP
ncbi:MAG: serine/threonine protein phosphatase, partial [Bacteroides sp.]